jgi:hypothetical protein
MDKLLKHAIDDNAVGFINRMKDKMLVHHATARESLSREVAADMAGVEVQESDPMHVFVHASGKGIKWRTSDQRTGGEASFSDLKDEKKLRAYFSKVFGSKKEFTLEIREGEFPFKKKDVDKDGDDADDKKKGDDDKKKKGDKKDVDKDVDKDDDEE